MKEQASFKTTQNILRQKIQKAMHQTDETIKQFRDKEVHRYGVTPLPIQNQHHFYQHLSFGSKVGNLIEPS